MSSEVTVIDKYRDHIKDTFTCNGEEFEIYIDPKIASSSQAATAYTYSKYKKLENENDELKLRIDKLEDRGLRQNRRITELKRVIDDMNRSLQSILHNFNGHEIRFDTKEYDENDLMYPTYYEYKYCSDSD